MPTVSRDSRKLSRVARLTDANPSARRAPTAAADCTAPGNPMGRRGVDMPSRIVNATPVHQPPHSVHGNPVAASTQTRTQNRRVRSL